SMLEPVDGSAPAIAGKFTFNPIGQIWSAALMLEHLGEAAAGRAIVDAIETLLRESGPKTRDMGGQAGTADVGTAIAQLVAAGLPAAYVGIAFGWIGALGGNRRMLFRIL